MDNHEFDTFEAARRAILKPEEVIEEAWESIDLICHNKWEGTKKSHEAHDKTIAFEQALERLTRKFPTPTDLRTYVLSLDTQTYDNTRRNTLLHFCGKWEEYLRVRVIVEDGVHQVVQNASVVLVNRGGGRNSKALPPDKLERAIQKKKQRKSE